MAECQLPKLNTGVRFPSPAPRRSKVRFAPTSFYARGKKDVIRPLPCSSFPTATRYAGLAVGGPPCGRHFSPLRNIDFNRPFHVGAGFPLPAPFFAFLSGVFILRFDDMGADDLPLRKKTNLFFVRLRLRFPALSPDKW